MILIAPVSKSTNEINTNIEVVGCIISVLSYSRIILFFSTHITRWVTIMCSIWVWYYSRGKPGTGRLYIISIIFLVSIKSFPDCSL